MLARMRVSVRRAAEAAVDSVGKTHSGSERCRRNVVHSDRWIGWRGSGVLFWRRENRAATLTSFQARLVKQIASPLLLRVNGNGNGNGNGNTAGLLGINGNFNGNFNGNILAIEVLIPVSIVL